MHIASLIQGDRSTLSCELFPPKAGTPTEIGRKAVQETAALKPAFISITCSAAHATPNETVALSDFAQNECDVTALAHLTCIGSTKQDIEHTLTQLRNRGIDNVLALRGDRPEGNESSWHASDLMGEIAKFGGFCVGGACYPEGHPESASLNQDLDGLHAKADNGCAFLTTQMFFDNNILYNFLYRLLKRRIEIPVIAGIMPVTNAKQIARICQLSGTTLPRRFRMIVDRFQDDPAAMRQAGIAYATEQIIDLAANGVNHVHIYTMNKPEIARGIFNNLSEIFR